MRVEEDLRKIRHPKVIIADERVTQNIAEKMQKILESEENKERKRKNDEVIENAKSQRMMPTDMCSQLSNEKRKGVETSPEGQCKSQRVTEGQSSSSMSGTKRPREEESVQSTNMDVNVIAEVIRVNCQTRARDVDEVWMKRQISIIVNEDQSEKSK